MGLRVLTPDLVEQWISTGAWQRRRLVDVVETQATKLADKPAVVDGSERLSYAELLRRSRALAEWMVELGLRPGEVFALQAPSGWPVPVFHLACSLADLVFLPLSDHWRRTELEHLLGLAGARALVVPEGEGSELLSIARDIKAALPALELVAGLEGSGDADIAEVVARTPSRAALPAGDPNAGRLAMITSGSTSLPRISLWSDNNLWFFLSQYRDAIGLVPTDTAVQVAPANTGSTGYVFPVLTPLLNGATSVMMRRWNAAAALEVISRERATLATAIPTQLIKMLQIPEARAIRLRVFTNSGAALAPDAAGETEDAFRCIVQTVYGASDGGVPVMTRVGDSADKRRNTVGRRLPLTDLRVVDGNLVDQPAGETGELIWRNPTKTHGYLNDAARTAEMFWDDGYYRSGDLGYIDAEGYLRVVGRSKDVIIRGGQNISPREIEDLVASHPAVAEVAVIGVPDAVYGERVAACVVEATGTRLTLDSLNDFLAAMSVAKHKLPERLLVFDELPKNAGGKIAKVELREAVDKRLSAESSETGGLRRPLV